MSAGPHNGASVAGVNTRLTELLDLSLPPIAIAFLPAPPPGLPRVSKPGAASCAYWRRAADGDAFYTEAADHLSCAVGAHTHGVPTTAAQKAELMQLIHTMVGLEYLSMDEVPKIPHRDEKDPFGVVAYAPLDQATFAPDIVLALHACDTATDEALYQGIVHEARLILCAPCCHHHLQEQLHTVAPLEAMFHDGILKHRLGDILTDTFRALILRILGYRADVVEFVAPEHTDKNLLIRAVRRTQKNQAAAIKEYQALKRFWGVTPYLETLLGERLQARIKDE